MNDDTPLSCDLNYTPVSCDLHDHLSAIANQQQECCLTYLDEEGKFAKVQGQIIKIYVVDGSDWCHISDGSRIRLDRIEEIANAI